MDRPAASNTLSIILAGGRGSRLHDLTDSQAKPALPIGPSARLIDFTLANVANSGMKRAMVLSQYAPDSLHRHLETRWPQSGKAMPLVIEIADGGTFGGFHGTADAIAKVIDEIDRHKPRHVLILAGDHLYQMDYHPFVERHQRSGAQVTVGAIHVPLAAAREFGVMTLDAQGRIVAFAEKPACPAQALDRPGFSLASMGIYVFDWSFLRALLSEMVLDNAELDFGKHVLPVLVAGGQAYAYALPGRAAADPLWRDLGTLDAYHGVHAELRDGRIALDPAWPITVRPGERARDLRSLLHGRPHLTRCSVGEGARIGERSVLDDVVVLPGARIGRDVCLSRAIVAGDAVIPDGFDLDRALAIDRRWCTISAGGIPLISARALESFAALETLLAQHALERLNDNVPLLDWTAQASRTPVAAPRG